ncbi:hypothetical protein AGIG_G6786 [Arapaima gigas]
MSAFQGACLAVNLNPIPPPPLPGVLVGPDDSTRGLSSMVVPSSWCWHGNRTHPGHGRLGLKISRAVVQGSDQGEAKSMARRSAQSEESRSSSSPTPPHPTPALHPGRGRASREGHVSALNVNRIIERAETTQYVRC